MSQGDKDHRQKLTPTEKKSVCMCASLRVDSVCVSVRVCAHAWSPIALQTLANPVNIYRVLFPVLRVIPR